MKTVAGNVVRPPSSQRQLQQSPPGGARRVELVLTSSGSIESRLWRARRSRKRRWKEARMRQLRRRGVDPVAAERRRRRARLAVRVFATAICVAAALLVGVTLHMAPDIDEILRKENEEYLSAIGRDDSGLSSAGQNVTSGPPPLLLDNP